MSQFSMTVDITPSAFVLITTFDYQDVAEPVDALICLDLRPFGVADTAEAVRAAPGLPPLADAAVAAVRAYLAAPWPPLDDPDDPDDFEGPGPVTVAIGAAGGMAHTVVADLMAAALAGDHGVPVGRSHLGVPPGADPAAEREYVTFADRRTLAGVPGEVGPGALLDRALPAVGDPRRLPIGELVFDHHFGNRVGVLALLEGTATARLLQVRDRGADGWEVTGDAPLDGLLGPQADEITAVARIAADRLRGDTEASPEAARYYQAAYDAREAMDTALDAALDALEAAGADAWWWSTAVTCAYGHELVAVAARDLIGTIPQWTQTAYDTLTAPWLAAAGR